VVLRFHVRRTLKQRHLIVSDVFLGIAAVNNIAFVAIGLRLYITGFFTPGYIPTSTEGFKVTQINRRDTWSKSDILMQIVLGFSVLFYVGSYYPKLSMVAFYYQIFPYTSKLRIALHIAAAYVVAGAVGSPLTTILACGADVDAMW
jgi:hypothetical protein